MIQINAVIDSKTQEFLQVKSETGSSMQMVRRDEKKDWYLEILISKEKYIGGLSWAAASK